MTSPAPFSASEWRVLCGAVAAFASHAYQAEAADLPAARALLARGLLEEYGGGFSCLVPTSEGMAAHWREHDRIEDERDGRRFREDTARLARRSARDTAVYYEYPSECGHGIVLCGQPGAGSIEWDRAHYCPRCPWGQQHAARLVRGRAPRRLRYDGSGRLVPVTES